MNKRTEKYYENGKFNRSKWFKENAKLDSNGRLISQKSTEWFDTNGKHHTTRSRYKNVEGLEKKIEDIQPHHVVKDESERTVKYILDIDLAYSVADMPKPDEEQYSNVGFKISTKLLNQGITVDEQRRFYNLFKAANERGEAIALATDDVVHPKFSLNFERIDVSTLYKRALAVERIMQDDYVESYARQEMQNFIDNFSDQIDNEDLQPLLEAIKDVSPEDFLRFLDRADIKWLSYALDSVIRLHGYEWIKGQVESITKTINKIKIPIVKTQSKNSE